MFATTTNVDVFHHTRCEIPPEVREYVRVTSWLHEEGTAIEIFPEKVCILYNNIKYERFYQNLKPTKSYVFQNTMLFFRNPVGSTHC